MILKIATKVIGGTMAMIGVLLWVFMIPNQNDTFEVIVYSFAVYFLIYIGVSALFNDYIIKNKYALLIHGIIGLPFNLLYIFRNLIEPFYAIFIFLSFYFFPPLLFNKIKDFHPFMQTYSEGITYIIGLCFLLIFAYKGNTIMNFTMKILKTSILRKHIINLTKPLYTRVFTYLLMIFIYITYTFFDVSKVTFTIFPNEILNVTKEILVTFIAIDALLQVLKSEKISR